MTTIFTDPGMSQPKLSLDFEGASGSNLFQYLTAVILCHHAGRSLLIPSTSRLYQLITCKVGKRTQRNLSARVLVNDPFLWGFARLYSTQLAAAWQIEEAILQKRLKDNRNFLETLELLKASEENIHLCGHFHDFDMGFFVNETNHRIVRDAFKFNSYLNEYTHHLLNQRSFICLHIRRGDVVFYHFFLKGVHYIVPARCYRDSLQQIWAHLESPLLYIATNGDLDSYLSYFKSFNPICYRDLKIDHADHHAVCIDYEIMRRSRILYCSPGFFSLSAALFREAPQQDAYFFDLPSQKFVKQDPSQRQIYRRLSGFSPLAMFPWREQGLLAELIRLGSQITPRILHHRRRIAQLMIQGKHMATPTEMIHKLGPEETLNDVEVSLLRLSQSKVDREFQITLRGKIDVFQ